NALVPSAGVFVLPDVSDTGASGGAASVAFLAALPFGQAKLSARPGVGAMVSPFARTFTAVASPWIALLPGPPSNSAESLDGVPPLSGTTSPDNGQSARSSSQC